MFLQIIIKYTLSFDIDIRRCTNIMIDMFVLYEMKLCFAGSILV
jgi:hypothetical protein